MLRPADVILDHITPGMAARYREACRILNSRPGNPPARGPLVRAKAPSPASARALVLVAVNAGPVGCRKADSIPAKGGMGAPLSNLTAGGGRDGPAVPAQAGRAPLSEPGTFSRGASRLPSSRAVEVLGPPAGRRLCESPVTNSGARP